MLLPDVGPGTGRGSGRHTIWIDNGVPLHIFYGGSRLPAINREWIDLLLAAAGKTAGLQLMDEPAPH